MTRIDRMIRSSRLAATLGAILLGLVFGLVAPLYSQDVDFNEVIKPLLSDRCFTCHGPDAENRQADLRLDQRASATRESSGEASHIIRPGDPDQSEVYQRITAADESLRMPPPDSKLALTPDEIELIRTWIEQGASWNEHWAFRPLQPVRVPEVADHGWGLNEIDRFVWHRLSAHRLRPNPPASRERLIRRVSFELTGLPPTLDEIDAFLEDSRDDAYERLVDRLLASERYGERMASEWLDVARYSDTYGYQVDRDRFVWPWRDWVIRAFNQNLPYDEFITQQLAGDLLPEASDDQILATTFNRLHPQKVEGGSTPEEFRIEYVADRNQTFATAFLGLTLECARCHDHKYDPLTQQEYYQLSAYFDNIDEAGLYSYFTTAVPTPTLLLPDAETRQKLEAIQQRIATAESGLTELTATRQAACEQWLSGSRADLLVAKAETAAKAEADSSTPSTASTDPLIPGRIAYLDFESPTGSANQQVPGKLGQAVQLTGDDPVGLEVGNFRRFEPFTVALWLNTPDRKERAVVFHRSRAWTDAGSRGYELLIEDGCLSAALIHFWPGNAIRVVTRQPLTPGEWTHVGVTYDGSSRASGLRIYVNGELADVEVVRDNLYKNISGGGGDQITIGERFRDRGFTHGLVDEFQVFSRQLSSLELQQLADGSALTQALQTPTSELTVAQRQGLSEYFQLAIDSEFARQREAVRALREERSQVADAIPEIMVMRELPQPRTTFVLNRGAYDARRAEVEAITPAVLPPFPESAPHNRLGLARWLTDPQHPLTARVAVNRYWQMVFGNGLVRTPEDFGSQGRPPTHPDLLDWLAEDFVQHGWDVKRLLKQMVMSATYRQGTECDPTRRQIDPENLWLARSPSYRWPAEMVRDNALLASGLLVGNIGGPPTKPYEVEVSFKPEAVDAGDGVYRRSLYTYWKRTAPAPVMMTFDAAKRDVCRVRRERTASPLQSLSLLNDPQIVEAARALSVRVLLDHESTPNQRLDDLFRWLTSRRPDDPQRSVLRSLYEWQLDYFTKNPEARDQYLSVGRYRIPGSLDKNTVAALAIVANTLLNYDECVTKR